jgi:uncharacterized membrane protein
VLAHLGIVGGLAAFALANDALAARTALTEKPGHATTLGSITIDAPPADVYRLITAYTRWPTTLSDVTRVTVESGGPHNARVRFDSKILEHEVAVEFDNIPDRAIRFHSYDAPPGAHARGEYRLEPIDGGKRTHVTASFTLQVGGLAKLLISSAKVDRMRRAKLARDLDDVARSFQDRASTVRPTA